MFENIISLAFAELDNLITQNISFFRIFGKINIIDNFPAVTLWNTTNKTAGCIYNVLHQLITAIASVKYVKPVLFKIITQNLPFTCVCIS